MKQITVKDSWGQASFIYLPYDEHVWETAFIRKSTISSCISFRLMGLVHQFRWQLVITSLCFLECSGMHTDGFDAGPSRMIAFWRQLERRRGSVVFMCRTRRSHVKKKTTGFTHFFKPEIEMVYQLWMFALAAPTIVLVTVDGRNPANQLRLVVYPIIYRVLYTSQVVQDWWFHIFLIFTSNLGEMIQFGQHIFQMGWNHQLDQVSWMWEKKIRAILRNLRETGSILVNPPCPEKKNNQLYLSSKHTFLDNRPFGQSYFQLNYAGFSSQQFFPRILDLGLPLHFCDMDLDLHLVDSCRMIVLVVSKLTYGPFHFLRISIVFSEQYLALF